MIDSGPQCFENLGSCSSGSAEIVGSSPFPPANSTSISDQWPSTLNVPDIDLSEEFDYFGTTSSSGSDIRAVQGRHFTSPMPWLRSWGAQHLDGQRWAQIVAAEAFSLPKPQTLKKLIRSYFVFFQPCFPFLKERDFHLLIQPDAEHEDIEKPEPISLALFNAMMFIASAVRILFVKPDMLR